MPRSGPRHLASEATDASRPGPEGHAALGIESTQEFPERTYRIQRASWAVMAMLVLAGLGGLFGGGPLSDAERGLDPAGLRVNYSRFARAGAPDVIRVSVPPRSDADAFVLLLDRAYLDRVRLDGVTPSPTVAAVADDRIRYVFAGRAGPGRTAVTFHLTPQSIGVARTRVGMPGGADVAIWQFVYP
jgi:hypothetical protein